MGVEVGGGGLGGGFLEEWGEKRYRERECKK